MTTPWKALLTGKPSPSKPWGAVVTFTTLRTLALGRVITLGRTVMSLTVTAGIFQTPEALIQCLYSTYIAIHAHLCLFPHSTC